MIQVHFNLHPEVGAPKDESRRCEHVPRVGELITFDSNCSYQVVDVLWNMQPPNPANQYVTVTAFELQWHSHMARIDAEWKDRES